MASIKKRSDGIWRARYRDDTGREHARHFARKVDAQRWLDEVTTAVVTGSYVDPRAGVVTFADFYRQWAARQVWAPTTVKAMGLAAGSVPFADREMRAIRRSHIEAWVKTMTVAGLAPGTITTRFNNVRSVFRGARRDRVIGSDPTEAITLPRRRRPEVAMRIPTPETVGKIMAAAEPWFAPLIGLCAFAGLRLGEAAGVQVDDIDFLRKALTVSRQVQRAGGTNVDVRPPKYGSERVVYLPERTGDDAVRTRPNRGSAAGRVAIRRRRGQSTPPGHRSRRMAPDAANRRSHQRSDARSAALLCLGADRCWLRCGDSAAGPWALLGDHHLDHVQPPMADRRGPHPQRRRGRDAGRAGGFCGLPADFTLWLDQAKSL